MCEWGNAVLMTIGTRQVGIDKCIAPIVFALNYIGMKTIASCCGHGKQSSNIVLEDGREILICSNYETARKTEKVIKAVLDENSP